MKNIFISTSMAVLVALSFSTSVQADDDSGAYVGIGLHRASFNTGDLDSANTKGNLSLGYMFDDRWGVDLSHYNIADDKQFDIQAVTLSGVYKMPISERFDAYGKLGFARTNMKISHPVTNASIIDDSGSDLAIGLGVKMDYGQHNVLLEYNRFDPTDADLDILQLGYRYEF